MLIGPRRADPRLFVRPAAEAQAQIAHGRLMGVLRFGEGTSTSSKAQG
jgi:hypothetical protein